MKKLWVLWKILVVMAAVLAAGQALALPNPPSLANTTWEGKYEMVYATGTAKGTISFNFTSQNGTIVRGTATISPPFGNNQPKPFWGMLVDGELHSSQDHGELWAKFFYDNSEATPAWKMRGIGHVTFTEAPYKPSTWVFTAIKK